MRLGVAVEKRQHGQRCRSEPRKGPGGSAAKAAKLSPRGRGRYGPRGPALGQAAARRPAAAGTVGAELALPPGGASGPAPAATRAQKRVTARDATPPGRFLPLRPGPKPAPVAYVTSEGS